MREVAGGRIFRRMTMLVVVKAARKNSKSVLTNSMYRSLYVYFEALLSNV